MKNKFNFYLLRVKVAIYGMKLTCGALNSEYEKEDILPYIIDARDELNAIIQRYQYELKQLKKD